MRTALLLVTLLTAPLVQAELKFTDDPGVHDFIDEMVHKHSFNRHWLNDLFAEVRHKQDVIDAITRPAESKPWFEYRPIFLTEKRIREGVRFWDDNAELLQRAEESFGVPAQIVVAIIGVETFYGRHRGGYRVMDSLATLAFDYPPRGSFFRGQLEEYLLMAREEGFDPLELTGSYAGAMGWPQFIASSFRAYAVDFDDDGRRDLWENPADIIGSVANYFHQHRWRDGEPIASRAQVDGAVDKWLDGGLKPQFTVAQLAAGRIEPVKALDPQLAAALLALETRDGPEYWITLNNFYVISRYNHSPLYSMAVYQLSEAIRTSRGG